MKEYNLIWADEFDYEGLPDPSKWSYDVGGHGFGNAESQYYTKERLENARVEDGRLIITALKEEYEENHYTSAKLTTYNKASFQYGRIEIKAKLPKGIGSWPAIWMLPNSIHEGKHWPLCGEIDIMEHLGRDEDQVHFSLHSERYNHIKGTQQTYFEKMSNVCDEFKVYAIDWTEQYIEFFVDDRSVYKVYKGENGNYTDEAGWPFDQPFYLILNIAVGGHWGGKINDLHLPYVMEFEYVRVYEIIEGEK